MEELTIIPREAPGIAAFDNYALVLPTLTLMPLRDPEAAARFRQKQFFTI